MRSSPLLAALIEYRINAGRGPMPQWQVAVFESLSRADQQMIFKVGPLVTPAVWMCLEAIINTLRDADGAPLAPGQCADLLDAFAGLRRFQARNLMGLRVCLRARRALAVSRALRRWAGPGWGRAVLRRLVRAVGGLRSPPGPA